MPVEIQSPPYPDDGITADGLYNRLRALRKWVLHYRKSINTEVGSDIIPDVKEIPDKKAYLGQPVMVFTSHLLFLKKLREQWDHLIRLFEDEWDCPGCMRHRAVLVQMAAMTINSAFIPYEVREIRQSREREKMQRLFETLMDVLYQQLQPEDHSGQKALQG